MKKLLFFLCLFYITNLYAPCITNAFQENAEISNINIFGHMAITDDKKYIYILTSRGYKIYDIINPASPIQVAVDESASISHTSERVLIDGDYLYTVYDTNNLLIYDIKDRKNPKLLTSTALYIDKWSGLQLAISIVNNKTYLYITADINGIYIVDVTDRTNPQKVTQIPVFSNAIIIYNNKYLYAGSIDLIKVFDISNPMSPINIQTISFPDIGIPIPFSWAADFWIDGDILYVAPLGPVIAFKINTNGTLTYISYIKAMISETDGKKEKASSIAVCNNVAYVACERNNILRYFDVSNPANMQNLPSTDISSGFKTNEFLYNIWCDENYVYVEGFGTIKIYNTIKINSCQYTILPISINLSNEQSTNKFSVVPSSNDCTWTAISDSDWILIDYVKSGVVSYSVSSNRGKIRNGKIIIKDSFNNVAAIYSVTQQGVKVTLTINKKNGKGIITDSEGNVINCGDTCE